MMNLFNRQAELIVNGRLYKSDDIDIEFNVPFSTENEIDISEIIIYNLSPSSIASIKKGTAVSLSAGYGKNIGMLVSGMVSSFNTDIESVDKKTTLKIATAIKSWQDTKINKTYAKNTSSEDILRDLIASFGVSIADMSLVKNVIYKKGKTVSGRLKDVVINIAKETQSKFYLDKNRAYIRPYDKGTATGFLLSGSTGLIGSPQLIEIREGDKKTRQGWKVQCLLNHNIFTDSLIMIDSKAVKGTFRVVKGMHTSNWTTEMEVI
ncbi:MAG: phage protein [Peptoanaerobacter stomatis]|uniref:phage protein n=1 Tax=Peptoanaerobacter stomatis TaxID=796937 RepID=UPI003FA16395